jgi:hypothetical protein
MAGIEFNHIRFRKFDFKAYPAKISYNRSPASPHCPETKCLQLHASAFTLVRQSKSTHLSAQKRGARCG